MRNTFKKRWVRLCLMGAVALALAVCTTTNLISPDSDAHKAAPPAPKPAPVISESPSASPSTNNGGQAGGAPVVVPTQSANDLKALGYLDFHWDVFADALAGTNGTKLSATQIAKPTVAIATDLSGCPPSAENRTSKDIKTAIGYCGGEIKLVTDAFLKLSEFDQRVAVASAFIYHALAKTTAQQRKTGSSSARNDARMLGCLQASLSYAFEKFGGGQPEDVWVVMKSDLGGGNVYNSYQATYDFNGVWS